MNLVKKNPLKNIKPKAKTSPAKKRAGKPSEFLELPKKAKKWTGFASDLVDLGLDKVKKIEGAGKPKKPSAWIAHVKAYAAEHQVPYKQAMMEAKTTYKK